MTEREAIIALNLIPDIGSARLRNLLEAFGSAPRIFLASESRLRQVDNIGSKISRAITRFPFEDLKKELDQSAALGIRIITFSDKDYPENLKNIYDPPLCLYIKGNFCSGDKLALAVVGSRRASYYGLSCAEKFSYSLASLGITIVSGLARGIDTKAHEGALKAQGRTIAILGSGLNCIYPPENKKLAQKVAESGAVASEFPINYSPLARNFPRRNRVISGLSLGVIVVEAAQNSGALITSDFALEQGRSVFAVPGGVNSVTSFGTNHLIKQGAKLVDSVEDILEELASEIAALNKQTRKEGDPESLKKVSAMAIKPPAPDVKAPDKDLSEEERRVYCVLSERARYIDEIIEEIELPSSKIISILIKLEMQKIIKEFPGKRFARVA